MRSVTSGIAVVETILQLLDVPIPAAAYCTYAGAAMNGDANTISAPF